MPRFFTEPSKIKENKITLSKEDSKHIKTVLRGRVGEDVTVCDCCGMDYACVICSLDGDEIVLDAHSQAPSEAEPRRKITLYQGLPKADKMEMIIQKCVELGVEEIVAVSTERAIVKLDKKEEKKLERWQKIAEAAAKQSSRGKIPQIRGRVLSFGEAVKDATGLDGALIPYEKEETNDLRGFVQGFSGETIGVFIGPEGGFSEKEIALAVEHGVLPVTLGKRILRTETAGMTTIGILLYELG